MKLLKFLICFISVPMIPILMIGIVYGIGWYIWYYYYIAVPIIILGLWLWGAVGLYKEWF